MSDSLWLSGLQRTRLPCPSLSPRVCSNSCPLGQWCPSTISSSVASCSSCPQSFQASGSFQWVGFSHQVAKVLKLQPQSFQQISGLISYRIDWFDLLAVQGTLKSLLHHHSSKASCLGCSAFFMVQFSHMYITTGKTIALTIWVFVGKMMSLLLYTPSRFVIAFLPRSKHLLILWLQSPFTVILEPKKIKFVTVSTFPPSICHEVMGLDAMILVVLNIGFPASFFILLFHLHQEAL